MQDEKRQGPRAFELTPDREGDLSYQGKLVLCAEWAFELGIPEGGPVLVDLDAFEGSEPLTLNNKWTGTFQGHDEWLFPSLTRFLIAEFDLDAGSEGFPLTFHVKVAK